METKQQINKHHNRNIRAKKKKRTNEKTFHTIHKQNDNAKWKKESHEEVKQRTFTPKHINDRNKKIKIALGMIKDES